MREILLRGQRVDSKEWVYGGIVHQSDYYGIKADKWLIIDGTTTYDYDIGEWCDVIPESVGQYTGLMDKNGKKIYEGDIVKYQFDNDDCPFPNKNTEKRIGRVFFSDFRASFSITAGRNGSASMNNDLFKYVQNGNRVEVIGNIYDNPELLEVEE